MHIIVECKFNSIMKIVINKCYGGFGLSKLAKEELAKLKSISKPIDDFKFSDIGRNDPDLVKIVETLGSELASDNLAKLKIVEIPDNIHWYISDYDGIETVHEHHSSWD